MEFRFKNQRYQEDAAAAVVSVFQGQPKQDAFTYLRDKGKGVTRKGMVDMFYDLMLSDEGYANAPVQLSATQLLDNIRKIQRANNISESDKLFDDLGACQLDIEMETGTGKTYVYTKTMLELNKAFGWTKFIIVVPGVAIREGVFKSLQNTEQHFFEQYGRKINFFIYDSDNLTELDRYSESSSTSATSSAAAGPLTSSPPTGPSSSRTSPRRWVARPPRPASSDSTRCSASTTRPRTA